MKSHQQLLNASIALAVGEALGLNFWNRSPTTKEITDYYFSNDEIEFSNATYLYLSSLSSMIDTTKNYPGTSDVDWWKAVYDNALLFFLSWNDEFDRSPVLISF